MIRVSVRSRLRCAYCHADALGAVSCAGCRTLVHPACSKEARGCPTLGCVERPVVAVEREWAVEGGQAVSSIWSELGWVLGVVLLGVMLAGLGKFEEMERRDAEKTTQDRRFQGREMIR